MYSWKVKYFDNPEDNNYLSTIVIAHTTKEAVDIVENRGHLVISIPKIVRTINKNKQILSTATTGKY